MQIAHKLIMTQNNFDLSLAQSLYNSNDQFPIDFDDAWVWLEYSRKDSAKRSFEKCGFIENVDFVRLHITVESDNHGNLSPQELAVLQKLERIKLSIDCFKMWSMMTNTSKGNEVRLYFLECEKIAKDKMAQLITKEVDALEKVKQFNFAIEGIFSNTNIEPELISGIKLNYAKEELPLIASALENHTRQLLINATAKEFKLLTVTELGKLLTPPLSAVKTNQLLIAKGYQVKNPNKKGQKDLSYIPTPLGEEYCSITLATGKTKSDTYQQLRWYDSIVSLL